MANEKLIFDILQGQNTLQKGLNDAAKSTEGIEKELKGLAKAVPSDIFKGSLGAGIALKSVELLASGLGSLTNTLGEAIHEASLAEDALRSLEAAFIGNGTATKENIADIQAFASSVQKTTKIGDDAVISNVALLRSLTTLNQKGLKVAFNAANDLSAALNLDLNTAIQLIARAANGNITAFQRYGIAVKSGKNEAESFSNVLNALAGFQGRAASLTDTFSGATAQSANAFSDLLQALGEIITKNPQVIGLIKSTTGVLLDLAKTLETYGPKISQAVGSFIDGFKDLGKASSGFIDTQKEVSKNQVSIFSAFAAGVVESNKATKGLIETSQAMSQTSEASKKLTPELKKTSKELGKLFQQRAVILDDAQVKKVQDLLATLQKTTSISLTASIDAEYSDRKKKLQELIDIGAAKSKQTAADVEKIRYLIGLEYDQKRAKFLTTATKDATASFFGGIKAGAAGAQAILANVVDRAVSAVSNIPVVGQIIAAIAEAIKFFAQGEKLVREQTKAFVESVKTLPKSIVEGAAAFVTEIVNLIGVNLPAEFGRQAPVFIDALIAAIVPKIPDILIGLQQAFVDSAYVLEEAMPRVAVAFATGIIGNLPKIVLGFIKAFYLQTPQLALLFANELIKQAPRIADETAKAFVQSFKDSVGEVTGGAGKAVSTAGNVLQDIGNFLGFADGGIVPGNPSKGDSVPALLTPGEAVLPNSVVDKIDKIANQPSGPQTIYVTLQLGEQQLATTILNLKRQGYQLA